MSLSSLIALLLLLQIVFVRITSADQVQLLKRQQLISQGQQSDRSVRELAARIYQLSQQTNDTALKDLLTRQQITITPPSDASTNAASAPATAPR